MSDESYRLALKILALVDESPSELFSFERKQMENHISDLIQGFSDALDNERDVSYDLGYDDGFDKATEDADERIGELEDQISELEDKIDELEDEVEKAFTEGLEVGQRMDSSIDTIELS